MFKHWKECSQDLVPMDLSYNGLYYIKAQAWHIKGYLGGNHSWCAFKKDSQWLVVELTTRETLNVQSANVIHTTDRHAPYDGHRPFISDRAPNAQWFGHDPVVEWIYPYNVNYADVVNACYSYPHQHEFNNVNKNCNTFTSFLLWKLNIDARRNTWKEYGWKSAKYWDMYSKK
jgi:hypothetical protein